MNVTSGFIAVVIGLTVAVGADYTSNQVNPSAEGLYVRSLAYSDGMFSQSIGSVSGNPKGGTWTAEIYRTVDGITRQLCAGSGVGNYNGHTQTYTPDDWTGATCPALLPTDIASVVWEYKNETGLTQSVSVEQPLAALSAVE